MKLNAATRTTLLLMTFTIFGGFKMSTISWAALACLPRVGMSSGKPLFWSFFGQSGDTDGSNDGDGTGARRKNGYDKETEEHAQWTTSDWIQKHKYELETHNVSTVDGYHLTLQRMPRPGCRPVLLVHGLLTSSLSWVIMGPGKSLAFLLFEKSYDVWLANLRGSIYGRNHTRLTVKDADFWSFSFHEMGAYDLPAIIDHVRNESSFHQVLLIGHSQALNAFLVLCTLQPEYNERILFMQALAPILELRNFTKFNNDDVRRISKFLKAKIKSQSYEVFPEGYLQQKCVKSNADARKECSEVQKIFLGSGQYNRSLEPIIYGKLIQGGSLKEIQHLQQIWKSGDFVSFDYGAEGNLNYYNTVNPIIYDLKKLTVPLVLYFGDTDAFATPAGVHRIYSRLLSTVIGVYHISAQKFNHLDFLCASDVKSLVNNKLIETMENYLTAKLKYIIE